MNSKKALSTLQRGNKRYVVGEPRGWRATPQKRRRLSRTQHPLACILTCSDSRVCPELIFDQCIGDLFVVRNAGTILTPEVIGSVEFAVSQLEVPLVVVMAHSGCGAIAAAVSEIPLEGAVAAVIRRISPMVRQARKRGFAGKELESEVSRRNTANLIDALPRRSHQIKEAVDGNAVEMCGAFYDLASGRVHWNIE